MQTTISKAGSFPVIQDPCPHYLGAVNLNVPRAAVLHTTECSFSAAKAEFKTKFAPTFLLGMNDANKNQVEIHQLIPIGQTGAALEKHNEMAIIQVEMVGYSKEGLWLPDTQTMDALASLMNVIRDVCGVPLSHPYPDGNFGMYGYNNHHRDKFGKMPGWFGHADVPDNAHWDPGDIEWSKIFARAQALEATPVAGANPTPTPSTVAKPLPPTS